MVFDTSYLPSYLPGYQAITPHAGFVNYISNSFNLTLWSFTGKRTNSNTGKPQSRESDCDKYTA